MNLQINKINRNYINFMGYVIYNEKRKKNQYKKSCSKFQVFCEQLAKHKGLTI